MIQGDKTLIVERKEVLEKAKETLKKEFIGLDSVINEIVDLIEPWYLFSELQFRPLVINLWGMTGVGKTDLIKKLAQLIDKDKVLYRFDMGDYQDASESKLKTKFTDDLKDQAKKPIILVFDEFQLGKTLTEKGEEIVTHNNLRALWDLLDSGTLDLIDENYNIRSVYRLLFRLENCLQRGVEVMGGVVVKNKKAFEELIEPKEDEDHYEDNSPKKISKSKETFFVPEKYYHSIAAAVDSPLITKGVVKRELLEKDGEQTVRYLVKILETGLKPVTYDYTQSLIFVIGNLDEAYRMSRDLSPDSDVDRLHQHSLKITLPDIKEALLERFRPEQISRLGNNHIIYRCFNKKQYEQLIKLELTKSRKKFEKKFNFNILFDDSIYNILYKEGVFPTQGIRPIFGTIASMIESYYGKILADIIESEREDVYYINWKYKKEKHYVSFLTEDKKLLFEKEYKVTLKIESLRKSVNDEDQANTAIHESGHVITSCFILEILPKEVLSKTAESSSDGFCSIDLPSFHTRDGLLKDICVDLAGRAAEIEIFGKNNLTIGAKADLESATSKALKMIKTWGMGDAPMVMGYGEQNVNVSFIAIDPKQESIQAKKIIEECYTKTEECIKREKYLLLKLAEYLTKNSRMDRKQIKGFVNKYAVSTFRDFRSKDSYYGFKSIIKQQIEGIENNETTR